MDDAVSRLISLNRQHDLEKNVLKERIAHEQTRSLRKLETSLCTDEPQNHLVIGDAHAHPDQPLDRFEWAGKFALETRPDVIVSIGDWWDMKSLYGVLHGYEGSYGREGKYLLDVQAGIEARRRFWAPIAKYNRRAKEPYQPRLVFITGNHEHRIWVWLSRQPELLGHIGMEDLLTDNEECGNWEHVPFLRNVSINGVVYCHYATSPGTGKAMGRGSVSLARNLILKHHVSMVVGHSHRYSMHEEMSGDGRRLAAYEAGCLFSHDEAYAGEADNRRWRRGLLTIRGVRNGEREGEEWRSLDELREEYGG